MKTTIIQGPWRILTSFWRISRRRLSSIAKRHRTVEELWYFVAGRGEMGIGDEVADVGAGVSVHIPVGTRFQFRTVGDAPLEAVAVTMPPWPGEDEAVDAEPFWPS